MCHHITPQAGENGAKKRGKTAGKGEKTRDEKEKGKDGNRLERRKHSINSPFHSKNVILLL